MPLYLSSCHTSEARQADSGPEGTHNDRKLPGLGGVPPSTCTDGHAQPGEHISTEGPLRSDHNAPEISEEGDCPSTASVPQEAAEGKPPTPASEPEPKGYGPESASPPRPGPLTTCCAMLTLDCPNVFGKSCFPSVFTAEG